MLRPGGRHAGVASASEVQTAMLFGACCAAGGALLCAAWSGWRTERDDRSRRKASRPDVQHRRLASGSTRTKAVSMEDALLGGDASSPRSRRLAARQKSMSQSNAELSKLMSGGSLAEDGARTAPLSKYIATEYGDVGGTFGTHNKIVIAMVGLPARGKSYIVKMLVRYLEWIGFPTRIFNVGDLRRRRGMAGASAEFFKSGDDGARRKREELAMACQEEMYAWLDAQPTSCVAIFDATNTTRARREALLKRARAAPNGVSLIFVESICDDEKILARNYRMKLQNADYKGRDPEEALRDFKARVREYEQRYETVEDDEYRGAVSYIKIINVGEKIVTRKCSGYLSSQISFFLGNVHVTPRTIWLALHAESVEERQGGYGGTTAGGLTARGRTFARRLAKFVKRKHAAFRVAHRRSESFDEADASFDDDDAAAPTRGASGGTESSTPERRRRAGPADDDDDRTHLLVLTGNAPTHKDTVAPLLDAALGLEDDDDDDDEYYVNEAMTPPPPPGSTPAGAIGASAAGPGGGDAEHVEVVVLSTSLLNELCGGDFDGISGEELERRYPGVWKARNADKLRFRYPGAGGESYVDVIARLRPILIELERQRKSVLIVSHLAVLRCLYAYFLATPAEQIPYLQIPSGAVVELNPAPHGATATTHVLVSHHPHHASAGEIFAGGASGAAFAKSSPYAASSNGEPSSFDSDATPNKTNGDANTLGLAHCARSAGDLATVQAGLLNGGSPRGGAAAKAKKSSASLLTPVKPPPKSDFLAAASLDDRVPVRSKRSLS
mmetsp:Transcript_10929/g.44285  ORF Transcript_10929/g.44285 Transcript_10929/m.44285 type:complete len:786 (+) Transcript_10929:224-2581(+)